MSQTSIRSWQRSLNTQPSFGTVTSVGGRPGSARASSMSPTSRGMALIRPLV